MAWQSPPLSQLLCQLDDEEVGLILGRLGNAPHVVIATSTRDIMETRMTAVAACDAGTLLSVRATLPFLIASVQ
jgi:hypothetical protein